MKKKIRRGRRTNEELLRPYEEKIKSLRRELRELYEKLSETEKAYINQAKDSLGKFERFLNIARGKVDIKYRLRLLLDPDNIKTTTRLNKNQVDFCFLCDFSSEAFPEAGFKGLSQFATEFRYSNISFDGLGRKEAIQYEGAIGEGKLLQRLNIFKTEESKAGAKD